MRKIIQTNVRFLLLKGELHVREQLVKAMQRNQLLNIMYLSKTGDISKRRIKIVKIVNNSVQAFCFLKNAKRTFIIENVLAVAPIIYKERDVV